MNRRRTAATRNTGFATAPAYGKLNNRAAAVILVLAAAAAVAQPVLAQTVEPGDGINTAMYIQQEVTTAGKEPARTDSGSNRAPSLPTTLTHNHKHSPASSDTESAAAASTGPDRKLAALCRPGGSDTIGSALGLQAPAALGQLRAACLGVDRGPWCDASRSGTEASALPAAGREATERAVAAESSTPVTADSFTAARQLQRAATCAGNADSNMSVMCDAAANPPGQAFTDTRLDEPAGNP